jgi:AmiR/NasT family two-component response regulator
MAIHRVNADEAFTLLVEHSQKQNVKVRDLAQQFIHDVIERDR